MDFRALIETDIAQRPGLRRAVSPSVNETLRNMIDPGMFIDTQALLCGEDYVCPIFTSESELISYDGSHLTESGARFLGSKLLAHPLITRDIIPN